MKCVETGKDYRIFKDNILGFIPYYILEDTRKAVFKSGVWYNVKLTNFYFKTINQVRKSL
tara:strand:+ start:379 stop:558 length:180 start_codon:yes stop_codon:yes gene_type:complete